MKKLLLLSTVIIINTFSFSQNNTYIPGDKNIQARQWFINAKSGMFIHWGPFSILGDGEWVMNNRNITVKNYSRLKSFFNPVSFNAAEWVSLAKRSGMKYITFVTRHHDGFSLWNTKYSDFNIMNTPYKQDIVKQLADECHKQGVKLFFYYSLLDWRRDDYSYQTGRTGKGTGRTNQGKWGDYIQFMKNQLTELLTNNGEVGGIWFDGHWDQLQDDKDKTHKSKVDWHYDEIYKLIHDLQPQCLIGNNHHLQPFPSEDFQMFEKDLPGGNTSGFGGQSISSLPLETCETINNSWGFNITDTTYKTNKQLIDYLVRASGFGANFLLNIGPMPDGTIQPEFIERLNYMGDWLKVYGESIYNTRGGYIKPQECGAITQGNGKMYIHVLQKDIPAVKLLNFPLKKISKAYLLKDKIPVRAALKNSEAIITIPSSQSAEQISLLF